MRLVDEKYSLAKAISQLMEFFQRVVRGQRPAPAA
jgi:hypothetical protein